MKKRLGAGLVKFLKFLPGLMLRLCSVWLLASFTILYYRGQGAVFVQSSLLWPGLFFACSLVFSGLLYYWDQKNDTST